MHALIRHYHAFSLLRRAIRPSLPSIICSFIMHPIPSAGSSKASSQLHSDCLAPSGSSLISIPLLLFLFIAFHFLFYIITYLFRVPQGVILSILLIYFNLLYLKLKIFIIFRCKTMIDQMAALIRDAVTVIIRHPILKVNQIIKFPVCRPFYMYMIRISVKLLSKLVYRAAMFSDCFYKTGNELTSVRVFMHIIDTARRNCNTETFTFIGDFHPAKCLHRLF